MLQLKAFDAQNFIFQNTSRTIIFYIYHSFIDSYPWMPQRTLLRQIYNLQLRKIFILVTPYVISELSFLIGNKNKTKIGQESIFYQNSFTIFYSNILRYWFFKACGKPCSFLAVVKAFSTDKVRHLIAMICALF